MIMLFIIKTLRSLSLFALEKQQGKLSFFHIEYCVSGKPNNLLAQFVALQGSKAETVVAVQR